MLVIICFPIRRVKVREQKLYAKLTLCFFSWLAYDIRHGFSWFAPETGYRFFRGPHMTLDIVLSRLHDIGYRFFRRDDVGGLFHARI